MKFSLSLLFCILIYCTTSAQVTWDDAGSYGYPDNNESVMLKSNNYIGWKANPSNTSSPIEASISHLGEFLVVSSTAGVGLGTNAFNPDFLIDSDGNVGLGKNPVFGQALAISGARMSMEHDFSSTTGLSDLTFALNDALGSGVTGFAPTIFTTRPFLKLRADGGDGTIIIQGQLEAYPPIAPSDLRLKKDIEDLHDGLEVISTLRPVSYRYINKDDSKSFGLIAQEVESVFPSIVADLSMSAEDGTALKGIKYQELIPVLIKAVQELHEQNVEQASEIESLKSLLHKSDKG